MTVPHDDPTEPGAGAPDATLAPALEPPAPLAARAPDGYEIEAVLGHGGMGVVYLARHIRLARRCALKMIRAGDHANAAESERFRTEAQAIARLQHPGIVQVFEVGDHEGRPFMALEYCPGGALDRTLARTPLAPTKAAALVRDLAEAVVAAHAAHVLHRDLKPANVLLTSDGRPKIADFGLAKKLDEPGGTRTGAVLGTPSYMPPEQARGATVDVRADVYALGAILYECLTGRPPFKAATVWETIAQVIGSEVVAPRQLNNEVPRDLETICLKCLQKEPHKRYASAQALADDLGRFLAGQPVLARPVGPVARGLRWVRRNPVVAGLLLAVVLVVTAGLVASWRLTGWALAERGTAQEEAHAARRAEDAAKAATVRAEELLRTSELQVYAGQLALAQSAFAEGNGPLALQHLAECRWDLRGWEHQNLELRCTSVQTLRGHSGRLQGVAWSPDGTRLVTVSGLRTGQTRAVPGEVKVWDAARGVVLLDLTGHTSWVGCVAWSPDGRRILTGSHDKTARIWDAQTGKEALLLRGHVENVRGVAWSPDGQRVLTGDAAGSARVWDAQSGAEVLALPNATKYLGGVAWSPDGRHLVTSWGDGTVRVWDAATGAAAHVLRGHARTVYSVGYHPDGTRLLTGGNDAVVRVWDARTGQELHVLRGHRDSIRSVAFSPNGARILTSSDDLTARVWDARTGEVLHTLRGHEDAVNGAAYSPDGRRIATASADQTARVWDGDRGQDVLTLEGHHLGVRGVTWSPDNRRVVTAGTDRVARLWDAERGTLLRAFRGHTSQVMNVAVSSDGTRLATGSADGTAKVWDAETGAELHTLRGHAAVVYGVAFSPDGTRLVTGGFDSQARVWDVATGRELRTLPGHTGSVQRATFSPDGRFILTSSRDQTARVWDAATGEPVRTLTGHTGPLYGVAWSADGTRLLTGSEDATARVWDAATGQLLRTLPGNGRANALVAFSPDGRRILTAGMGHEVSVWDAERGVELLSLRGHTDGITDLAWSPDGTRVVTGSTDGTAKVWDARKPPEPFVLQARLFPVRSLAFTADGQRLFGWDVAGVVLAWDTTTGQATTTANPPPRGPAVAVAPDGRLTAWGDGLRVLVAPVDRPAGEGWPLPDAAERQRYHTANAAGSERAGQWYAAAFHLGRLLLDDPADEVLKQRRAEALRKHFAGP